MNEEGLRFCDYIKDKRLISKEEYTITQLAKHLNVSRMFYCDVENGRRGPFAGEKLELLAELLHLSEEETAKMYDLAGQFKGNLPYDIQSTLMNDTVGGLALTALRLSKGCDEPEAEWKQLIRELENKRGNKKNGG
jgi:transcriptional regulator with XRE-family HTH domain